MVDGKDLLGFVGVIFGGIIAIVGLVGEKPAMVIIGAAMVLLSFAVCTSRANAASVAHNIRWRTSSALTGRFRGGNARARQIAVTVRPNRVLKN